MISNGIKFIVILRWRRHHILIIFGSDSAVFTFSIHQQRNYPAVKPPSDQDVGIENRTGDDEYLALLETHLPEIVRAHEPQLAFYLAGADPYRGDQLGGLDLSIQGLRERDRKVINILRDYRVPIATTTAGGYALSQSDTVEIHCNTIRAVKEQIERERSQN